MTAPSPSQIRVVRLYSGAQMFATRGITPVAPLSWPSKHPLSNDWWWIDATGWCQDIGDVIGAFTLGDVFLTGGDGEMSVLAVAIAPGGLQVGIQLSSGTPGVIYTVTVVLNGALGFDTKAIDISILCFGFLPPASPSSFSLDFSSDF